MRFSIRTRLTVWYTGLLAVSLLVFAVALYLSFAKIFTDKIDEQIESVSGMMVHTVIGPSGRLIVPRHFDVILERFFGIKTTGNYIQILTANGRVVAKSSSLEGFILPLSEEAHRNALKGKSTFEVIDTMGRFPVRTITKPVVSGHRGFVAIIQVGSSLEVMEKIFRYIVYIFVIGGVSSVLVASAVGWFLARKALKPVNNITSIARKIEAENLGERIDFKGPNDEIKRLAETFNDMIARLEASFRQIKQFTGDASHELRTPLTVMKGEIEVMLRGDATKEELRETLESALEEIDRMNAIVNNLLDLARADVEVLVASREPVRLDKILADSVTLLKRKASGRGVKILIVENTPVIVTGDSVRLGQVALNLLDNAIKYNKEGGSVMARLTSSEGMARLTISDTGIGISVDEIAHIFDRFYRVDKARARDGKDGPGGAGLGLNICKAIIDSLDGEIKAESEDGMGSTFTVLIPLHV